MDFNFKKMLLAGTALVVVGGFAISGANATEYDTTGASEDWGSVASDSAGTDADSVHFNGASHSVIVDDAEDIGTTTNSSLSMSIDTRSNAGEVIFDGGALAPATGTIVYGAVGDSSDFTVTGNAATLTIGDGASNEGATVSLYGNVAAGTVINFDTGVGTTTTLTLGDGSTATTVAGDIDLDEGTAGDSDAILNLNGTTVTGTITNTDVDNTTPFAINVDATSSIDGNLDLTSVAGNVIVDDGLTLNVGATTFDVLASGTVVLGDATTAGATLVFDGTGAQGVTGLIGGDTDGVGTVSITNTGGTVTFNNNIGASSTALATFAVGASATANTVGSLDATSITVAAGAELDADGAVTGDATIASTGTLDLAATLTGDVANSGTLQLAASSAVVGDVTGAGALDVDATSSVTGDVAAATADIAASSTLTVSSAGATGTVGVTTTTFNAADSAVEIDAFSAGTTTWTGNFVANATGDGDLILGDDSDAETEAVVITGNIGSSTKLIDDITVGGGTGSSLVTATLNGNVYADDVTIGAGDTLNLYGTTVSVDDFLGTGDLVVGDGTDATTVTSTQTAGTADLTNVTVADNATLHLQGDIRADVYAVNGTLKTSGSSGVTATVDTSLTIGADGAGTVILDTATTLATSGITFGDSSGDTISFRIGSNADFDPTADGALAAGGAAVTFTTGTVTTFGLSDSQTVGVETGDVLTFIDGASNGDFDTEVTDGRVAFDNGGLLVYDYEESVAGTIRAAVTYADAADAFDAGSTGAGVANFLVGLTDANAAAANLDTIRDTLLGTTAANQQAVAESLAPTVDGGFVVAGVQASGLSAGATNARIASARSDNATGMVAGEMGEGVTVWTKAFGQLAEQDQREGVAGYDADTYGVAVGIDTENLAKDALVGVALSYANTDVESDGVNTTDTDVDSYQVSLYGNYDVTQDVYVSGMLGYARNNIDQTRHAVLGVSGNNANADFDSDQVMAYAEVGKDFMVTRAMKVTPRVLANYQHVSFDSYTETGSTANLAVSTDDMDIFELGVGVDAAWDLRDDMGNSVIPSVSAEYRYDLVGDEVSSTSSFTAGGASFQTSGYEPEESSFTLGAGLAYEMDENWTISADYDYNFKEDYDAHNASIRAGFKF